MSDEGKELRLRKPSMRPIQDLSRIARGRLATSLLNRSHCNRLQAVCQDLGVINGYMQSFVKELARV